MSATGKCLQNCGKSDIKKVLHEVIIGLDVGWRAKAARCDGAGFPAWALQGKAGMRR